MSSYRTRYCENFTRCSGPIPAFSTLFKACSACPSKVSGNCPSVVIRVPARNSSRLGHAGFNRVAALSNLASYANIMNSILLGHCSRKPPRCVCVKMRTLHLFAFHLLSCPQFEATPVLPSTNPQPDSTRRRHRWPFRHEAISPATKPLPSLCPEAGASSLQVRSYR